MTEVQVVAVDGSDLHAGTLYVHRRRGVESATFAYDPSYLADRRAYALDPALRLVAGAFQTAPGRACSAP